MKSKISTFPWWGFDDTYYREIDAFKSKSPEELSKLAEHKDARVRENVASNLYSSLETLDKLSYDVDRSVRRGVADNPNTPTETLDRLSYDLDEHIRFAVTLNQNTSSEALTRISSDEWRLNDYPMVRWWIAKHPNTPADVLENMLWDKEWLENLRANDPKYNFPYDIVLFCFIVKNPNVSNETLNKIIDGGFIGHERARDVLEERSKHYAQS